MKPLGQKLQGLLIDKNETQRLLNCGARRAAFKPYFLFSGEFIPCAATVLDVYCKFNLIFNPKKHD